MGLLVNDLFLPARFTKKLSRDLEYILQSNIQNLLFIVLFGSCVNGKIKVTSDIDLMIVTDSRIHRSQKGSIAANLEEAVDGVSTDVIFYTIDDLRNGRSLFLKQIIKEGVVLWKKD